MISTRPIYLALTLCAFAWLLPVTAEAGFLTKAKGLVSKQPKYMNQRKLRRARAERAAKAKQDLDLRKKVRDDKAKSATRAERKVDEARQEVKMARVALRRQLRPMSMQTNNGNPQQMATEQSARQDLDNALGRFRAAKNSASLVYNAYWKADLGMNSAKRELRRESRMSIEAFRKVYQKDYEASRAQARTQASNRARAGQRGPEPRRLNIQLSQNIVQPFDKNRPVTSVRPLPPSNTTSNPRGILRSRN